ncbi:hypothetical protein GCM10010329_85000 [Streptomyces spiroverticillatus]|uniref:Uncharacterized protein n=1 Tax=Streptomyces finlayi TaxID=67296 RepID=A0A918XA80_9ACTN|nr:hypothetical protein GCM10010329_85000 [Streptomyces spiroverticillatus]GHD19600.1 hypothetical protein GCM10010334_83430 [Streptomyces finlayi]
MKLRITPHSAPPLWDIRQLGAGDVVVLVDGYEQRPDWVRYAHAMSIAIRRGVDIERVRGNSGESE